MSSNVSKLLRALSIRPTRRLLVFVGLLGATIALGTLVAKVHKLVGLPEQKTNALDVAAVLSADLLALTISIVGWIWALHLARGLWRTWLGWLFQLCSMILLLFLVVEHGFYLATGSLLDWNLLRYSAEHLSQIKLVIASEMGLASWAGLAAAVVIALAPSLLLRGSSRAPADARPLPRRTLMGGLVLLVVLGLAHAVLGFQKLPAAMQPLRPNAALLHIQDCIADVLFDADDGGVTSKKWKPVDPLVVVRGDQTKPYNVALIVLESVRADVLTPYNPSLKTAPFLAKLAKRGLLAEEAYTVIPHTTKSLIPLHCGIYPKVTPRFHEATAGGMPADCLARLLGRFGYATHFIQSPESVFERRRDLVKAFGFERLSAKEDIPSKGFQKVGYFGFEDDVMLKPAFDWLDEQKEGPFFLGMLNATSHHPYEVPKNFPKGKWNVGSKLSKYYDSLRYVDRFMEKLFTGFEERGLLQSTVFVIVGDHGEGFNEHGHYGHDDAIHEEGLRVPLFLVGAGVPEGVRVDGLWQHIDVLPTLLDVLKLRVVAGELPGKSLLERKGHERLFYSCWRKKSCLAMREGDRKVIYHYDKRDPELYDLAADPMEKEDLIAAGKVEAASLDTDIAAMKAWRDEVNGRFQAQAERRKTSFISDSRPEDVGTPVDVVFNGAIRLLGYKVERHALNDGDATWVTCYYEVLRVPKEPWELWMHASGPHVKGKHKLFNTDHIPVEGSYPIEKWQKGQFITDRHWLRMPPGYPTGDYELLVGFYKRKGSQRLRPSGTGLSLTASSAAHLGTLKVTNPRKKARDPIQSMPAKERALVSKKAPASLPGGVTAVFAGLIRLNGVTPGVVEVVAGGKSTWTWHLEVLGDLPRWTDIFVHVEGPLGGDGKIKGKRQYLNATHRPLPHGPDVGAWKKGWHVTDRHTLSVSKRFPPGKYRIMLGFWDPNLDSVEHRLVPETRASVVKGRVVVGHMNVGKAGTGRVPKTKP